MSDTKYQIHRFIKYASKGNWQYDGYLSGEYTYNEAQEILKKYHHNGEVQYCKESLCSGEHWWKDVIYAVDHEIGFHGIYTMSDYLKDLFKSGEWNNLTDEQKSIILACSK